MQTGSTSLSTTKRGGGQLLPVNPGTERHPKARRITIRLCIDLDDRTRMQNGRGCAQPQCPQGMGVPQGVTYLAAEAISSVKWANPPPIGSASDYFAHVHWLGRCNGHPPPSHAVILSLACMAILRTRKTKGIMNAFLYLLSPHLYSGMRGVKERPQYPRTSSG
jgi:hypothetical protein